jgi:hypothetical protein
VHGLSFEVQNFEQVAITAFDMSCMQLSKAARLHPHRCNSGKQLLKYCALPDCRLSRTAVRTSAIDAYIISSVDRASCLGQNDIPSVDLELN